MFYEEIHLNLKKMNTSIFFYGCQSYVSWLFRSWAFHAFS